MKLLISETTRQVREQIVSDALGSLEGNCDGCMAGLAEMYQDYIDGKREIREINMAFKASFESGEDGPVKEKCSWAN